MATYGQLRTLLATDIAPQLADAQVTVSLRGEGTILAHSLHRDTTCTRLTPRTSRPLTLAKLAAGDHDSQRPVHLCAHCRGRDPRFTNVAHTIWIGGQALEAQDAATATLERLEAAVPAAQRSRRLTKVTALELLYLRRHAEDGFYDGAPATWFEVARSSTLELSQQWHDRVADWAERTRRVRDALHAAQEGWDRPHRLITPQLENPSSPGRARPRWNAPMLARVSGHAATAPVAVRAPFSSWSVPLLAVPDTVSVDGTDWLTLGPVPDSPADLNLLATLYAQLATRQRVTQPAVDALRTSLT